jgi:type VI secretion system secreted protein VgrG
MHNDKESLYTLTLLKSGLRLQVLQFSGAEGLNQPYRFSIEMISLAPAINLDRLLQQPAYLNLGDHSGIHGIVHSASLEHRGPHRIGYHLVLVPYLQNLDRHRSRRVFDRLSVPAILHRLFQEHALPETSYRLDLATGHYPPRPFCIQYEETDLALLQRLCEEEGIHYHFEHRHDGHVLVLADDTQKFPQEPLRLPFQDTSIEQISAPVIHELFQRHGARAQPERRIAHNLRQSMTARPTTPLQPHPLQLLVRPPSRRTVSSSVGGCWSECAATISRLKADAMNPTCAVEASYK